MARAVRRGKVTVRMDDAGVRALLNSPDVLADLARRAEAVAEQAGPGMEVDVQTGRKRGRASVRTATPEAVEAESRFRDLTAAIDQARH